MKNDLGASKVKVAAAGLLVLLLSAFCGLSACRQGAALKIGVMLPLTGSYFTDWKEPLQWAVDNVNESGGVAGRRLKLVFADTGVKDIDEVARRFIDDRQIVAVIGPVTSSDAFNQASKFLSAQKPMITPSATSDEIFRAFAGKKFIWRTVESNIAQVRMLLLIAAEKGAQSVSLICSDDAYGNTFFNWFGFFATELGIEVGAVVRYDQTRITDCSSRVAQALASDSDALIAVPSGTDAAVCIARETVTSERAPRLLFSDAGQLDAIITELGDDAEGIEGLALSPDMSTGFEIAYSVLFGRTPPPYAANAYDAVCLLAYGLARSGGQGGEALAEALAEVVDARGERTGWDKQEIGTALAAIRAGALPDISGATGTLNYDVQYHTDLVSSTYALWRVEAGAFVTVSFLSSGEAVGPATQSGLSIFQTLASEAAMQDLASGSSTYDPPEKTGLWAFVMAGSSGWQNYRHQADALAQYQLLKENGLEDDRIILILEDDIAGNAGNSEPGVVRNVAGGPNLYDSVEVDYRPSELASEDIFHIISGEKSDSLPWVIESTQSENVLVFFVSHGGTDGVYFDTANYSGGTALSPEALADAVDEMVDRGGYRRMFIAVEACHGGTMGTLLDAPGVLLAAAANPYENSLGANYDPALRAWLADQFAYQLYLTAADAPETTFLEFYEDVYLRVNGSHVTVYNAADFGDVSEIALEEFYEP